MNWGQSLRVDFAAVAHESSTAFMATYYGLMRDTAGLALAAKGVGAGNLVGRAVHAYFVRVPVVCCCESGPAQTRHLESVSQCGRRLLLREYGLASRRPRSPSPLSPGATPTRTPPGCSSAMLTDAAGAAPAWLASVTTTKPRYSPIGRGATAGPASHTLGESQTEIFDSEGSGSTKKPRGPATLPGGPTPTSSGCRTVPSFSPNGVCVRGMLGVFAQISQDEVKAWEGPQGSFPDNQPSGQHPAVRCGRGYPSSVQLENGTIVTAYYCQRIPMHQRYHMGVVRWRFRRGSGLQAAVRSPDRNEDGGLETAATPELLNWPCRHPPPN